jgi:hypothetical protein
MLVGRPFVAIVPTPIAIAPTPIEPIEPIAMFNGVIGGASAAVIIVTTLVNLACRRCEFLQHTALEAQLVAKCEILSECLWALRLSSVQKI